MRLRTARMCGASCLSPMPTRSPPSRSLRTTGPGISVDGIIVAAVLPGQAMGVCTYAEGEGGAPRAVVGLTDLSARKAVRNLLGKGILTFSVPYDMYREMERNYWEFPRTGPLEGTSGFGVRTRRKIFKKPFPDPAIFENSHQPIWQFFSIARFRT